MSPPVEHDYIGLSERKSSAGGVEEGDLNLEATELRLGLPGSESPHREEKVGLTLDLLPKGFVSGAKRGFSDANDGGGKWGFEAEEGGSGVNLAQGGGLFSQKGEVAAADSAVQTSGLGNVGEDLAVKVAGQERKVTTQGRGSVGNDSPAAPAANIGLRNDGRLDDRSYWVSHVMSLSISLAIPLVYPRMISIHDLTTKENDSSLSSSTIPLSSEHINDDGIYLLENGEDCLIYVGNMVNPDTLQKLFGVTSVDGLSTQLVLQQFDNDLSEKLNDVINEIRQQRCSYLRLRLCRKGDPTGMHFLSYMVEDKTPGGLSYVEFLVHVHRQIQTKMA